MHHSHFRSLSREPSTDLHQTTRIARHDSLHAGAFNGFDLLVEYGHGDLRILHGKCPAKAATGIGVRQLNKLDSAHLLYQPSRLAMRLRFLREAVRRRMGFATLIDQLRETKERYTRAEGEYLNILERSPDGVVIYRNGVIRWVNPRITQLLGYAAPHELVGSERLRAFAAALYGDEDSDAWVSALEEGTHPLCRVRMPPRSA